MKHTNKEIILLKNAYDGIMFNFELKNRIEHFIEKYKSRKIYTIEINNIEILPDLEQLKYVLLSMSKNKLINSIIFIESELTSSQKETFNLLSKMFNRPELKIGE